MTSGIFPSGRDPMQTFPVEEEGQEAEEGELRISSGSFNLHLIDCL